MFGTTESSNVGVASSIIIREYFAFHGSFKTVEKKLASSI